MLKISFIVQVMCFCSVLNGCSSEHSSTNIDKISDGKKAQNQINKTQTQIVAPVQNLINDDQRVSKSPSRSELRVLTEEAKLSENEVKSVIEQFDANLGNREGRKDAEDKFKKILPGYKEKMIQIGKAKLKEQN